jgi:hypothetical protein
MITDRGHFDLSTPEQLYEKAVHDYLEFFDTPDSWALFNVLTSFNHLLEWICPEAKGNEPKGEYSAGTRQQQFYWQIRPLSKPQPTGRYAIYSVNQIINHNILWVRTLTVRFIMIR